MKTTPKEAMAARSTEIAPEVLLIVTCKPESKDCVCP
jgi:hypothetical protein